MPIPKVTYFDFAGSRGEEVRLALVIAGVAFDDNRIKSDDFARIKAELPFGSIPVFEMPGHGVFAETNAILRLIGRLHSLHPDYPWDGARHDAVLEACEELRQRVLATSRIADAGEKKAARQALAADYIPRWAKGTERLIGEGPFVGGAQPDIEVIDRHREIAARNRAEIARLEGPALAELTALVCEEMAVGRLNGARARQPVLDAAALIPSHIHGCKPAR